MFIGFRCHSESFLFELLRLDLFTLVEASFASGMDTAYRVKGGRSLQSPTLVEGKSPLTVYAIMEEGEGSQTLWWG